jgi:hypothetical protein
MNAVLIVERTHLLYAATSLSNSDDVSAVQNHKSHKFIADFRWSVRIVCDKILFHSVSERFVKSLVSHPLFHGFGSHESWCLFKKFIICSLPFAECVMIGWTITDTAGAHVVVTTAKQQWRKWVIELCEIEIAECRHFVLAREFQERPLPYCRTGAQAECFNGPGALQVVWLAAERADVSKMTNTVWDSVTKISRLYVRLRQVLSCP